MSIIRPFEPDDLEPVVSLLNKTLIADPMTSKTFQRKVLLDPNFDTKGALVAEAEGQIVGFVLGLTRKTSIEDQKPDLDRAWITLIAVNPSHQRQGIGKELLTRLEPYFIKRGAASIWVSPYAPNYFTPGVDIKAYPNAVSFFKKNGFEEAYRPISMDASLLGLNVPQWVMEKEQRLASEGVKIEYFEPRYILPLLDFAKAEFPGDWQRYVREMMLQITLGRCPCDQLWLAVEEGKVLGFAQHEGEHFGPFGVASEARGRGIGAVLMFKCLDAMRKAGLHNAWLLWTEDKAAELYSKAGFIETRRYVVLRKVLD